MAKPAKSIPATTGTAIKPAKSKKLLVIIIAALGLVFASGAVAWYFTRGGHTEAAKQQTTMAPRFIKLDTFTVNLRHDEDEGERVLQTMINLEVHDEALEERIKLYMPKIYNNLLILLSKKRASELSTAEGKQRLAQEIKMEAEAALGLRTVPVSSLVKPVAREGGAASGTTPNASPAPAEAPVGESYSGIVSVLFTSFIIQ